MVLSLKTRRIFDTILKNNDTFFFYNNFGSEQLLHEIFYVQMQ